MTVHWMEPPTGLELEFYTDVNKLLESSPFDWYVTEGFRSKERSDILYAAYLKGGPRAAPGGKSPHNIGEAIDVVHDGNSATPGCQMDWNTSDAAWKWLFDAIKQHPRLHSGLSFSDAPHIESVKFARDKKRDSSGSYYLPITNLKYVLPPQKTT